MDRIYDCAIHEAAHCIVGVALGLAVKSVEVRPDGSGTTAWKVGAEAKSALTVSPAETASRPSAPALLDELRNEEQTFDLFIADLRAAVGGSDVRVLHHLAALMAARIAMCRVGVSIDDAFETSRDDRAVEDILLLSFGPQRMQVFGMRARRIAENLVAERWQHIAALAGELHARGRLEGAELDVALATATRGT